MIQCLNESMTQSLLMLTLSESDYVSLRKHGEETYPHECCGVMLGQFGDNGAESVTKIVSRIARCGNTRADSPHRTDSARVSRVRTDRGNAWPRPDAPRIG